MLSGGHQLALEVPEKLTGLIGKCAVAPSLLASADNPPVNQ